MQKEFEETNNKNSVQSSLNNYFVSREIFEKIFFIIQNKRNYNLDLTLDSGQTFRWQKINGGWEGVIYGRWVRLEHCQTGIKATVCERVSDWSWLEDYLQIGTNLKEIFATFPRDQCMKEAMKTCRGLRIAKQEPWECLASFLMSSNKQIPQIKQIINNLCERFGERIKSPDGRPLYAFPRVETIAKASEEKLRECKMGFRAKYLKQTAEKIVREKIDLRELSYLPYDKARETLLSFPGVGRKIADCVMLFSLGFNRAFPIDVWIEKALRTFYFDSKPVSSKELEKFAFEHFGEYAGYAQQYLYHYIRILNNRATGCKDDSEEFHKIKDE